MVRLMGIVEPQRRILRKICPQFREMEPHGVENYCCGGRQRLRDHASKNFSDWRSGHLRKDEDEADAGDLREDVMAPETHKYVCAPCSNCKGQIRDLFDYYGV